MSTLTKIDDNKHIEISTDRDGSSIIFDNLLIMFVCCCYHHFFFFLPLQWTRKKNKIISAHPAHAFTLPLNPRLEHFDSIEFSFRCSVILLLIFFYQYRELIAIFFSALISFPIFILWLLNAEHEFAEFESGICLHGLDFIPQMQQNFETCSLLQTEICK